MPEFNAAPHPEPGGNAAELEREIRELHASYAAPLRRYAAALARSPEIAPDAAQEVFLRFFVERSYGRVIEHPRSWLFRALHNYVIDHLKAASARDLAVEDLEHLPDAQQDPEAKLRRDQSLRAIARLLSAREWECLCLRFQGLAYEEIGAAMGLRCGTVGALLARATRKIRDSAGARPAGAVGALAAGEGNG